MPKLNATYEQCLMIARSKTRMFKETYVVVKTRGAFTVWNKKCLSKGEHKNIVAEGTR